MRKRFKRPKLTKKQIEARRKKIENRYQEFLTFWTQEHEEMQEAIHDLSGVNRALLGPRK